MIQKTATKNLRRYRQVVPPGSKRSAQFRRQHALSRTLCRNWCGAPRRNLRGHIVSECPCLPPSCATACRCARKPRRPSDRLACGTRFPRNACPGGLPSGVSRPGSYTKDTKEEFAALHSSLRMTIALHRHAEPCFPKAKHPEPRAWSLAVTVYAQNTVS